MRSPTPPRWGVVRFPHTRGAHTRGGIRHQPSYNKLSQVSRSSLKTRPQTARDHTSWKAYKPSTNESYIHFWRRFAQGSLGRCHLQLPTCCIQQPTIVYGPKILAQACLSTGLGSSNSCDSLSGKKLTYLDMQF